MAGTSRAAWRRNELFVLLSDGTNAVGVTAAAERGAQDPAGMDRLRGIFDRRPKRAGQPSGE
ncbi:hypothetical protein [Streptomyces sp. NBC_01637]|uniref:hypothetical protein n=1 Tax=unclassified Streptomyces TaxID=2593676 RepID=UPI00386B0CF6|nr:hypothetical protein OH719_31655 [Streptomyces sp. NBC_01653]WTD88851.1 hypothetical protein OG891_15215 [Streptomyces sp. NBC_01637]